MKGVLFLSTGGACRGPMAEALARALIRPDVAVRTAALNPAPLKPGIATVLAELGLEPQSGPTAPLGSVKLAEVGLVVTLSRAAGEAAAALPVAAREHWDIPEPPTSAAADPEHLSSVRALREAVLEKMLALARRLAPEPALGIIGGSGFYDLPGVSQAQRVDVQTPFGPPSAPPTVGQLEGRRVVFLARHGREHALLPGEVNARANIYALKRLGVTQIISVSAVGSLRDEVSPGDVVLPDQFIDRTVGRAQTFFGQGAVAHVSLATPVCAGLAGMLAASAQEREGRLHHRGTYLCIEGPQFSTRAESKLWRAWGADVVGMTNLPEARLAREAEICYATLALPTDYDSWRAAGEEVRVTDVISVLRANVEKARRIVARTVTSWDPGQSCPHGCGRVLDTALFTPPASIPAPIKFRLRELLSRRLDLDTSRQLEGV